MNEPREFSLEDVLTITTGLLLCTGYDHPVDGVYKILNFLTDESLFTHQLPRAARASEPWILEQHPALAGVKPPAGLEGSEALPALRAWVEEVRAVHGSTFALKPLPAGWWLHKPPVDEAIEMVGKDRVIRVIVLGDEEEGL